ncbi:MAG: hypothetical protein IKX00_02780 [Bacilli bacterium]|nr:hypothetical protein [Bacilli bacterium]
MLLRIFYLNFYKKNYYINLLNKQTKIYTYGLSAPRGKILDINGNVLVDNSKKRVIVYEKNRNISKEKEFIIAKVLSKYIKNNVSVSSYEKINYIYNKEDNIKTFLSEDDYDKYIKSIYSYSDVKKIADKYILDNLINNLNEDEYKIVKIYNLMNKDYSYDKKIIFDDISEKEYFEIINQNIPGISGEYIYERIYPYGNLIRSILGSTGKISKENKKEYLNKGYSLSDTVGISYLEKEYENILKGKKALYKVNKDGSLKLIKKEKQGEDIKLNIDINLEQKLSDILKKHISNTKGKTNAEYYKGSYVMVGKPTGEIVAALGYRLDEKSNFDEVTSDIINSSFTLGSVVKAASNTVAYHENVIIPGKKINDSCVKLYLNAKKCSYKPLGLVDDISSLEKSSNYYQFINALKIMGYDSYKYNMKVTTDKKSFDKYRNIFKSYGLGDKTYIDLPNESLGIKGSIIAPDLLLNLSIGQYDSYTPAQFLSYINTLANNKIRNNLSLSNKKTNMISEVKITDENYERILKGLNNVVTKGTAKGYIYKNDGAGKTGTSETLVDTNNDNIYETKTISTSFMGFMPYNNPKYTFIIISPNISSNKEKSSYYVPINRYIIHDLTKILFENM